MVSLNTWCTSAVTSLSVDGECNFVFESVASIIS